MTRCKDFQLWCLLVVLCVSRMGIAQIYEVGNTIHHKQQIGSAERMVSRDDNGFAQLVWTRQDFMDPLANVFYVSWDPATGEFAIPGGTQVPFQLSAGSPVQTTLESGFCFPAYIARLTSPAIAVPHVAIDFLDNAGAFTGFYPAPLSQNGELIPVVVPKIAHTENNTLHMATVEFRSLDSEPAQLFYSRGLPVFDAGFGIEINWQAVSGGDEYLVLDSTASINHIIAASQTGNRVAVAYVRNANPDSIAAEAGNSDVFLMLSENGGLDWALPQNITQFIQPDLLTYCAGAELSCCNRDTIRAFMHLSALFDDEANLHIAYSTIAFYNWTELGSSATRNDRAMLWHWDESSNQHHLIAEYWDPHEDSLAATFGLEQEQAILEHPSLAFEPATGHLYCAYLAYQPDQHLPDNPVINADVMISRSTDGGAHWSEGVNVTNTEPENNQNRSEQDISVAENVVASELYMEYSQFRAPWFDIPLPASQIYFQRVQLNELNFGDNVTDRPLHVDNLECDTTARAQIQLISVSQDYCDSIVVAFLPTSAQGLNSAIIFRNDVRIGETMVTSHDTIYWADHFPLSFPASYYVVGSHPLCGPTVPSDWDVGIVADPPAAVANFQASQNHWGSIFLNWSPNPASDSVIAYDVFRDSVWQVQVPGDCTSYVDVIGIPGNQYLYGVRASNQYCLGDTNYTTGRTIPRNGGRAALELANAGPPNWDYTLNWIEGCVDHLTIRSLCPGTTAEFIGTESNWTATQTGDSVIFSGDPLCQFEFAVEGFRLTNNDPDCIGDGTWTAGNEGGTIHGPLPNDGQVELPRDFKVGVFPNPFNPQTNFELQLPQASEVQIVVFDILGQSVREISSGRLNAGNHVVPFDGSSLATGIYFARIKSGEFEATRKLMLLK